MLLRLLSFRGLLAVELLVIVVLVLSSTTSVISIHSVAAWVPPTLGIGAMFLPVPTETIRISESSNPRLDVQDVSDFFVDSFWTGKVGGGARQLTVTQRRSLQSQQAAEFAQRYGSGRSRRGGGGESELIVLRRRRNSNNNNNRANQSSSSSSVASQATTIACVGVEVDRIPTGSVKGPTGKPAAPLMSNLAVSRQYRRRGLAERLVQAVEDLVRKEWGYDECYLYVEERNRAAVQLYRKLGYRTVWRDATAQTLLPASDGSLDSASTVIVCMRKNLKANLLQRLFGS